MLGSKKIATSNYDHPEVKKLYLRRRLYLFESKFKRQGDGKWTQDDWAELWSYSNVSSVSRIFNGQLKLQDNRIKKTCDKAGIDPNLFYLDDLSELAKVLGLPSPFTFPPELRVSAIQQFPDTGTHTEESDSSSLGNIGGDYIYAYSGRDERTSEKLVIFEKLSLIRTNLGSAFDVNQPKNIITETTNSGQARLRSGILEIDITYPSKYPNSRLLLKPMYIDADFQIMSGLYMDVSIQVDLQIFSTQCHLFKVQEPALYPHKIRGSEEMKEYALWNNVFEETSFSDDRLLGKGGHICYNMIRDAVIKTRKREAA